MAYYKRRSRARPYRRRFKRRTVYRRRPVRTRRSYKRVNRGASNGFPNKMLAKQVYTYRGTITTDVDLVLRGNGPYDPLEASGAGQKQPVGWDTYEAIYGSYKCLGSKISVIFRNQSAACKIYIVGNTSNSDMSAVSGNDLAIQPTHRTAILQTAPYGMSMKKLSMFRKTSHFYSKNDDGLSSATNGTPSEQWYWHVIQQDSTDLDWFIKVTYYTMFYDRKTYALDS